MRAASGREAHRARRSAAKAFNSSCTVASHAPPAAVAASMSATRASYSITRPRISGTMYDSVVYCSPQSRVETACALRRASAIPWRVAHSVGIGSSAAWPRAIMAACTAPWMVSRRAMAKYVEPHLRRRSVLRIRARVHTLSGTLEGL